MIIKTLVENTSISKSLNSEHGLSLYIETNNHKILFDTGASDLFAINASKMQVDLSKVDTVIISHGHYDHGGGLKTFLALNENAKIYINKNAFLDYYSNRLNSEKKYIGLDKTLMENERLILVEGSVVIDEQLELFSGVKQNRLNPSGNKELFIKDKDSFIQDNFLHEQNLVIKENSNTVVIAGCAHNGIVNILEHFNETNKTQPTHVIGGFHLYSRGTDKYEDPSVIESIGTYLINTKATFYTCHCTGVKAYELLKQNMEDSVNYLSTGSEINI